MSDRINALFVVLEHNVRDDDIQPLVDAIRQLRNVASVKLNVDDQDGYIAQTRARQELGNKLWNVLYPKDKAIE